MTSKLLIDEEPLQVLPTLAKQIGLNEALFLQQLHYWLQKSKHEHDGRRWIYNTYEEWLTQFPFWPLRTMQRIVGNLVRMDLVVVHKFNKQNWDRTNWYSINYEQMETFEEGAKLLVENFVEKRRAIASRRRNRTRQIGGIEKDKVA